MTGVKTSRSGDQATFVHGDSALTVSGIDAGACNSVDIAFTGIANRDTGARTADMA